MLSCGGERSGLDLYCQSAEALARRDEIANKGAKGVKRPRDECSSCMLESVVIVALPFTASTLTTIRCGRGGDEEQRGSVRRK